MANKGEKLRRKINQEFWTNRYITTYKLINKDLYCIAQGMLLSTLIYKGKEYEKEQIYVYV